MSQGVTGALEFSASKYMAVRVSYSEEYDIATNSSKVIITKVEVKSTSWYGYTYYLNGTITVDGKTAVSMSSSTGTSSVRVSAQNTWYEASGATGAVSGIAHGNDGSKSIVISVDITGYTTNGSGNSGWKATGSQNVQLITIPRTSGISVGNGTIGSPVAVTIHRASDIFTHTVIITFGNYTAQVTGATTAANITPPMEWCNAVPNETRGTATVSCITYNGSTEVGRTSAYITLYVPDNINPSCSLSLGDPTGYLSQYGGYVKGQSKIGFSVGFVGAYGSTVTGYSVSANGERFNYSNGTTGVVNTPGTNTVFVTVTDSRGRTGTASANIQVLDYSLPIISKLSVARCNEDGSVNIGGNYVKVTYSYSITPLSNKNGAYIWLSYKKTSSSEDSYINIELEHSYSKTNATYIFQAEDSKSYDVKFFAGDNFGGDTRRTVASTAFSIFHFNASGKGIAFGKISEGDNFEVGMDSVFHGNVFGITSTMVGAIANNTSTWFPYGNGGKIPKGLPFFAFAVNPGLMPDIGYPDGLSNYGWIMGSTVPEYPIIFYGDVFGRIAVRDTNQNRWVAYKN